MPSNHLDIELNKSDLLPESSSLVKSEKPDQASQGAIASLINEAYEHPVKVGLGVAAVAGAAGLALYARRGPIAERLFASSSKPNVLIVEDTAYMGMAMRDVLKKSGHEVTWVTGITKTNPLTAIEPSGAELSLAGNRKFQVALLDGDLGKGMLTGPELVASLRRENIASIGTSTVESYNIAMKANGAEVTGSKPAVFASLVGGKLDLKQALRSPQEAQAGLDALAVALREPENKALRKQADEILMGYINKQ